MSIFTENEKAEFENILKTVAETFERNVSVFVTPERTIISTDDSFSPFFNNDLTNTGVSLAAVKYTVPMRILYNQKMDRSFVNVMEGGAKDESQIKVENNFGGARIKVNASGNAILQKAKQIEIDGQLFIVKTSQRPHGVFTPQYYTYYLELI